MNHIKDVFTRMALEHGPACIAAGFVTALGTLGDRGTSAYAMATAGHVAVTFRQAAQGHPSPSCLRRFFI